MRRMREDSALPARVRRGAPGMPPEFDDPDDEGGPRSRDDRFGAPKRPWWRPASTVGRVFLTLGAMVVLGAFTTAGLMLKHDLERDARFRIAGSRNIQATGLDEVSRAEMLPVFGEDIGRNIFFVPLEARRRQLEQIPWIEHATVLRLLPDQIRVVVTERQPVAFTRHGQQIGLVDANGVLLEMAPRTMAERHYSFPVVTGIDPGDSPAARKERMAVYLRLIQELDAGGKRNSEQISEIDLTDPEDARVMLPQQGGDVMAHFGDERFLERLERYNAHIAEWRQQYPRLKAVDLRYDNQVVLEMASGKETAEAAPGVDAAADAGASDSGAAAHANADAKPSPAEPAASQPPVAAAGAAKSRKGTKAAQDKKHTAAKHAAAPTGKRNSAYPSRTAQAGSAAAEQGG